MKLELKSLFAKLIASSMNLLDPNSTRADREAEYSVKDVEGFAVVDEVDREIVQRIREAGVPGVLPKVVAAEVNQRGVYN